MTTVETGLYAQPEWNDAGSVAAAMTALGRASDEASAKEASDRFLWAVGNNHSGTFYPVVLATLPAIERLLEEGGVWAQYAAMESLIDLGGSFVPEDDHQEHGGASVQEALHAFIHGLRPRLFSIVEAQHAGSRSAAELIELIDDRAA